MPLPTDSQTTLTGEVKRVLFHNAESNFWVIRIKAKGRKFEDTVCGRGSDIAPGMAVECFGEWTIHPKYGHQFAAASIARALPTDSDGLRAFLCSPLVKGIGPKSADLLISHFGESLRSVLDEHPEKLFEVPSFPKKRAEKLIASWQAHTAVREVMIFLQRYGVTSGRAMKIWSAWKDKSLSILKSNPYRLIELQGFGFATADAIGLKLGIEPSSPFRVRAGIIQVLRDAALDGHCWLNYGGVVVDAVELLSADPDTVADVLNAMTKDGTLTSEKLRTRGFTGTEVSAVSLPELHRAEVFAARDILRLSMHESGFIMIAEDTAKHWVQEEAASLFSKTGMTLAEEQCSALLKALTSPVSIITGGPGCGKTQTIKSLLSILRGKVKAEVALCAPTGRAAKRMTETTGEPASTIHRLLEFRRSEFVRDGENPLECDAVVVDEASMLDIQLAAHLFDAVPTGCRLIIVGDVDQLPSVGPGNVLKDMIASDILPVTKLTKIFRQAETSGIVKAAHRIRKGEYPQLPLSVLGHRDFRIVPINEAEEVRSYIASLLVKELPKAGFNPMTDVQILTPMQRSDTGVKILNPFLQEVLNPPRQEEGEDCELDVGETRYRLRDKVLQRVNDYEKGVFNGDIGIVKGIDTEDRALLVDFDGTEVVYEEEDLDELVLAYAMTVHKAQGSEYPVVIMPLQMHHYMLLQRNLLYTAVTRAKKLFILVGDSKAVLTAVKQTKATQRFTSLAVRLKLG